MVTSFFEERLPFQFDVRLTDEVVHQIVNRVSFEIELQDHADVFFAGITRYSASPPCAWTCFVNISLLLRIAG